MLCEGPHFIVCTLILSTVSSPLVVKVFFIRYEQEGICEKHHTHDGSKSMQVENYCHLQLNVQSTYSSCKLCEFKVTYMMKQSMQWHSWLRHCATSQKVMGSILDGITGIFH